MNLNLLKKIGRDIATNDISFEEHLVEWWSNHYNLPKNHPLLLNLTFEELIVDYYAKAFVNNPKILKEFESEIGIGEAKSDEDWFKQEMGEDYEEENIYSDTFKKDLDDGNTHHISDPNTFDESF